MVLVFQRKESRAARHEGSLHLGIGWRGQNDANGYVFRLLSGGFDLESIFSFISSRFPLSQMSKKKRVHFNSFMTDVHKQIHRIKQEQFAREAGNTKPQPFDPIAPVADFIADEAYLICFDEFQVTDIVSEWRYRVDSYL